MSHKTIISDERLRDVILQPQNYIITDTGCWLWAESYTQEYPIITFGNRKSVVIHQFLGGGTEDGYNMHHKCHTKRCINPKHLEKITIAEHRREHSHKRY